MNNAPAESRVLPSIFRILVDHFFRRFFDNDTIQVEGDTQTTIVRALAIVIVPELMVSFWLQNSYRPPPLERPPWLVIEDHYFFVLYAFVVIGAVAIFEWDVLFPDRLDFLILTPLSIKPRQMLAAKATALVGFLALFLVGGNLLGTLILPAISRGAFFRQVLAHAVALGMAGAFVALLVLALGGVLLCLLDGARFRMASPLVQMFFVLALVLLLLQYLRYGDSIQSWLTEPLGPARWLPPLWFLGLYEHLLHGDAAQPFAAELSVYAVRATAAAAGVALFTYPLAWARMRKMAIEGTSRPRRQPLRWLTRLLHAVIRRPGERAVFHFIGATLARNNRYQVYLAMYCGTGLALALACAVTFHVDAGGSHPALSTKGLHATMPLLLFWIVAGLRIAFAFPVNLAAGWIFRITGVSTGECASAARRWALFCALGALGCILAALRVAAFDARQLLVQAVCGICLCLLLTDSFFFSQQRLPFNQPRMPGRVNFPIMLSLWGAFPVFVYGVIYLETQLERHPSRLLLLLLATAAIHVALVVLRSGPEEIAEEMEGYEGEFQLLGLS